MRRLPEKDQMNTFLVIYLTIVSFFSLFFIIKYLLKGKDPRIIYEEGDKDSRH